MTRTVTVVPHTHWDREWYRSFERFRLRLVELLDDLLPRLEHDDSFTHFMLDGQMAVVDDYLELRPEAEERIARLAASGRLGTGPWYVLMDEFLVSGETIVRDLQMGLRRAEAFGGAMPVGYLPDMFGHVAQMPQILRAAGIEHAVVWRGVPAAVERSAFWWSAPDGSTVRAEYLPEGYGNGASLPATGDELVAQVRAFERAHGPMLVGPILWMNGSDHLLPDPELGRVVAEANAAQDEYWFVVRDLASHLRDGPTHDLPHWAGELRSGARANLLMGVASNRVDVKQAAARAERDLERLAEPLGALFLPARRWPAAFLDRAWRLAVLDAAHDSSCACSADEVVDAVLGRYVDVSAIAAGLVEQSVAQLSRDLRRAGPVVVNPSARRRRGIVELALPGTAAIAGTQQLSVDPGTETVDGIERADAVQLVQRALDEHPHLERATAHVDAHGVLHVRMEHDPDRTDHRYTGAIKAEVAALADADPAGPARLQILSPPSQIALGMVDVPGFGWGPWVEGAVDVDPVVVTAGIGPDAPPTVANGLVTVAIDPHQGTLTLTDAEGRSVAGLDRLVDGGDAGDTYNWSPPSTDLVVDVPTATTVRVVESGPLRGRVEVHRTYRWPLEVADDARRGDVAVEVRTEVEVHAGSPLVRLTTELDNQARDHRLRTLFPLPRPADRSTAECAFATIERPPVAEGGPTERPLATWPSRRWVEAGGLLVVHEGLLEHELVDLRPGPSGPPSAAALAVTLLRCTGMLSRGPTTMRPLPAGPELPTPGAQMPGRQRLRYGLALVPDAPGKAGSDPYALVDELSMPLLTTYAAGGGHLPERGSALEVTGAEVSAVTREDGELTLRVYNPSAEPTTVRVPGRRGRRVDLRGRLLHQHEGEVALGPWEMATLRLDEPPPSA